MNCWSAADVPFICDPDASGSTILHARGQTSIYGDWRVDSWSPGVGGYCEYSGADILRDALCEVLDCLCYGGPPISDAEWTFLHSEFPNLQRCQTRKLGEATPTYNCLAWTVDDTSHWIWNEADANGNGKVSVSELNQFYSSRGITNIAYYGPSTSDVVHVAKKSGGTWPGCMASSKLGQYIRLAHDRVQLEGGEYSNIVGGN